MTFFSKRKRKNDDPPPFPAWIIVVVALGLVVFIAVFFQISVRQSSPVAANNLSADLYTATNCAPQGTLQPNVTAADSNIDPFELTATYIVSLATSEAQGTRTSCVPQSATLDPLLMTATRLVEMATSQAQGTPQPITINSASGQLDPLEITATHIVLQVTMTAQAGGS